METQVEWKEVWQIEYREIMAEVVHWERQGRPCWNYYLTVPVVKLQAYDEVSAFNLTPYYLLPETKRFVTHDFESAPIVSELGWHSGISWYKRIFDDFGILSGFELGCDYQHRWEEDYIYTFDRVYEDLRNTIDKLLELVPSLDANTQEVK